MANVVANGFTMHIQRLRRLTAGDTASECAAGPTVVFLHGLVVDNLSSLYYSLANPVAQAGGDAILYDLRGHGRSDVPPTGYALDDSVADLLGLLDALDVGGPVHLVGHSYGASIALRAGLTAPERVAGLVLIEPHCSPSPDGGDWVEDIADLLTASALGFEYNPVPPDLSPGDQRRVRAVQAAHTLLNATTLIDDVAASPPFTHEDLAGLATPVLAIFGEHTDLAPSAWHLEGAVPDCRLEILPGLGHSVLRDARDAVLALVEQWLATFPGAGLLAGADLRG